MGTLALPVKAMCPCPSDSYLIDTAIVSELMVDQEPARRPQAHTVSLTMDSDLSEPCHAV